MTLASQKHTAVRNIHFCSASKHSYRVYKWEFDVDFITDTQTGSEGRSHSNIANLLHINEVKNVLLTLSVPC